MRWSSSGGWGSDPQRTRSFHRQQRICADVHPQQVLADVGYRCEQEMAKLAMQRPETELVNALDGYIAHHGTNPKTFIWTKSVRDILQKVIRANNRVLIWYQWT